MFILGTANFGNKYPGSKTYVDTLLANLIVKEFFNSGGSILDTAEAYGKSLDIIQKLQNFSFNISTKFTSKLMLKPFDFENYLQDLVDKFQNSLSSIFLHDIQYLEKIPKSSFNILKSFLDEYPDVKFGVSIYYPEEIFKTYDYCNYVSIVQAPLNYFDRRFVAENFKNFCLKANIEITYRSIFLQGKILLSRSMIDPYFKNFSQIETYYLDYERSNYKTLMEFNINFVKKVADFSDVVIGVESAQQVRDLVGLISDVDPLYHEHNFSKLEFVENLCVPMKWKLT